jgi:hypothetical protein
MLRRIAVLGIALLLLVVAPALGVAALDVCPPCCEHISDGACEGGDDPCASLAMGTCCAAIPVAPAPPAKTAPDTQPSPTSCAVQAPPPSIEARAPADRDAARWWMQPSRFSVVRRL